MNVIIIDDEPLARMITKEYLQAFPQLKLVAECGDGFDAVKAIQTHQPDLIFLDIQLPKINGFEMLELIDRPPAVIFTTAFDEYAIKAFEAHAVDYLLKPFDQERFDKAVNKFLEAKSNAGKMTTTPLLETAAQGPMQSRRIVVKIGSKIKIIPVMDILYLESADDFVRIHTTEGAFLKNKTMSHFEDSLDSTHFVRCHRGYIISVQQVTRIDAYGKDSHLAILKGGEKIPVSRSGYAKLKAALDI